MITVTASDQLFAYIKTIRDRLGDDGAAERAAAIDHALIISTLPREILGNTRLVLERLERSGELRSPDLRRLVRDGLECRTLYSTLPLRFSWGIRLQRHNRRFW